MPLINKTPRIGPSVVPLLPEQVDNIYYTLGDNNSVTLSWNAPHKDENNSYRGVCIVRKKGSIPTGPNDGVVVYEGMGYSNSIDTPDTPDTPETYTITVTGKGDSTYCYLTINGSKVTDAGTYEVNVGDSVDCTISYNSSVGGLAAKVNLDGSTVLSINYTDTKTYSYKPESNATINLTKNTYSTTIDITTS